MYFEKWNKTKRWRVILDKTDFKKNCRKSFAVYLFKGPRGPGIVCYTSPNDALRFQCATTPIFTHQVKKIENRVKF